MIVFVKLGGSLITHKSKPATAREGTLRRLAAEIAAFRAEEPEVRLLVGHGSGSFGHPVASQYGTAQGAAGPDEWLGFARVWVAAHRLHRLVMDSLLQVDVAALSFPPSASAICQAGQIVEMPSEPIQRCLEAGLIPVVQGDVAFDRDWGATVVSTEQVFAFLAQTLKPARLLLAGSEPGVYADYPERRQLLSVLGSADLKHIRLGASAAEDVTGGMVDKVERAISLCQSLPGLEVRVFSGEPPGDLRRALAGEPLGTLIRA